MRSAVLIVLVSATAAADPGGIETSAEMSGGIAAGSTNGTNSMSGTVSAAATLGLGVGYSFSPRTSGGLFLEYGLGDAPEQSCVGCGYTITSSVRVLRAGLYGRRRYGDLVAGVRAGYEELDVTYGGFGSENHDSWRGIELLRPEVGYAVYDDQRLKIVFFAAASLGMFEYRATNGRGAWLGDQMSDMPNGPALHVWLMVGTRLGFRAF